VVTKCNLPEKTVIEQLQRLEKDGIISLEMAHTDSEITFLKPREDDITINPIAKIIEQQNQLKQRQIEAVISYVNNDSVCKSLYLLDYFGESGHEACGICSVCQSKQLKTHRTNLDGLKAAILETLETEALSSRQLLDDLNCSEQALIHGLNELLELKKITLTATNTYTLL
jgi:ATP-dependent DNA helicase RecQ